MITTKPEDVKMSLYQAIKLVGSGFDIGDDIFDWGNYFDFDETEDDYYNKCLLLFAYNIEFVKYQPKRYSICKVTDFINENKAAFDRFMNEENREGYRPMDYDKAFTPDDEDFYDLYITTFECLINGNYAEKNYEKLYNYLTEENEAE